MELLTVENLSFSYPQAGGLALENVTCSVRRGEFVALCGATGSGKSTLLRLLKRELAPLGERSGRILIGGTPVEELPASASARTVGFVMQQPEQQLVTDRVWHELAFGLENLGLPQAVIARRVAETASYFGIEDWYEREVSGLSGGQKQLLALASVMVMQPEILLLDEPTSQLDPIAASDFIATLRRLNQDFSLTVLLSEHRLEEVIPLCDRMLVLEKGRLLESDAPRRVIPRLGDRPELLCAMPAAARLGAAFGAQPCPLTVREGREWLGQRFGQTCREPSCEQPPQVCGKAQSSPQGAGPAGPPALCFRDVWFRYERSLPDVLRGLNLTVAQGELFCILGGNGSGKTTALSVAAGLLRAYSGSIRVFGKRIREVRPGDGCVAALPQDVQTVFLRNTVREELEDAGVRPESLPFDLGGLYDRHPYDLSGGEQQLLGLAKVLAASPRLLLLDEPTKGLDADTKRGFIRILRDLRDSGMTVVVVTHDVDFAAQCADRCALFFRGAAVSVGAPADFFSENRFYTTAANRITRGYFDRVVTVEDAIARCRGCRREGAPHEGN